MKKFTLLFVSCFLCACAGNPPQWWNPSGAYDSAPQTQPAAEAEPSVSVPAAAEEMPAEQTIEPLVEEYEELNLSPLGAPQDAGKIITPSQQAAVRPSSTSAASAKEETKEPDLTVQSAETETETETETEGLAFEEENLPDDGTLPPPSVLQ